MSARKDAKVPAYQAEDEREHLSVQIMRWRLSQKQSKRNFARKCGVPPSSQLRIENAASDPKFSTIVRMARGLGITVYELLYTNPPLFEHKAIPGTLV